MKRVADTDLVHSGPPKKHLTAAQLAKAVDDPSLAASGWSVAQQDNTALDALLNQVDVSKNRYR